MNRKHNLLLLFGIVNMAYQVVKQIDFFFFFFSVYQTCQLQLERINIS